jgi:uncharacterized membrane protein YhaH (DUF805 family)
MAEPIVNESEFARNHSLQIHSRAQKDIFFIWILIMLISVISAHFILNLAGGSPTGFVTAAENAEDNLAMLLGALMVFFIVVLITALVYTGVTKNDR